MVQYQFNSMVQYHMVQYQFNLQNHLSGLAARGTVNVAIKTSDDLGNLVAICDELEVVVSRSKNDSLSEFILECVNYCI